MKTECCDIKIENNWRYCPKCGQECRVEIEKKHEWEFYMNGSFCKKCGQQIGTPYSCK